MGWQLAQWACRVANPDGGAALKAVLCVLSGHADDATRRCYLSLARIAAEAWVSESTARRSIRALARFGAVAIVERSPGRKATAYEINMLWQPCHPDRVGDEAQPCHPDAPTLSLCSSNPVTVTPQEDHEEDHEEHHDAHARHVNGAGTRGGGVVLSDPEARWHPPRPLVERIRQERPDLTTDRINDRTEEWREYARHNGKPADREASWLGWMRKTPLPRRSSVW